MPTDHAESRLQFRPRVQVAPAGDGRWQVRWDFDEVVFLGGPTADGVLSWLVPLLDARAALREIEQAAADRGVSDDLRQILGWLREEKFVQPVDGETTATTPGSDLTQALEALGVDPAPVQSRLTESPVVILGRSLLADRIASSLRLQGFEVRITEPDAFDSKAFTIAIETDCSAGVLERLNRAAIAERRPWMLVGAWNLRLLIGPIFIPGQTACYECYRKRLDSHRAHLNAWRALEAWRLTHPPAATPEPLLPALADLAAAHAALEVFHFATDLQPARTTGSVLVYSPRDATLAVEPVLRIPWCPACSPRL